MTDYGMEIAVFVAIILLAIPYVKRICHPEQRPFAAYLIFVSVFAVTAAIVYSLLVQLMVGMNRAPLLEAPAVALLFLALVFLPAIAFATVLARKPRRRQGPPP